MLQLLRYSNPRHLRPLFQKVDPFKDTLLISHLRTKLEIQDILLQEKGYVVDESLLRISEFSELLFKRLFPTFKVLQRDLAEIKIKSFLRENFKDLNIDPELAGSLLEFIEFMGNFLCFPESRREIQDWFKENPDSEARWKKWSLVGGLLCDKLLSEGRVLRPWLAAFLVDSLDQKENLRAGIWPRHLWVDLRTDITWSEAELFLKLSKVNNVTILVPQVDALSENSRPKKIYDYLDGFANKSVAAPFNLESDAPKNLSISSMKVSGGLAEVRTSVAQVRQWLSEGIPPQQIAIVAPKIEDYWPMFKSYFKKEGIPVKKKTTMRFASLPVVQKWISKHHLVSKSLSSSHLETMLFHPEQSSLISFSDFSRLYSRIYDSSHLERNEKVFQKLSSLTKIDYRTDKSLTRDEFVGLSISLWDFTEEPDVMVHVLKDYVDMMETGELLPLADHLHLLEKTLSRKEKTLTEEADGVVFTAISSGHTLELTHKIYLGLLQENFKNKMPPFIPVRDIQSLQRDLGLHIENPEEEKTSTELLLQKTEDLYLKKSLWVCPATHLMGESGTPHPLWIEVNRESSQNPALIEKTVWDFWQQEWDQELITEQLQELSALPVPKDLALSPSSVRDLLTCPFIFTARKIYGLEDPEWVDVETPASEWGRLQHSLLEKILREDLYGWTESILRQTIDSVFAEFDLVVSDVALLKPLKEKLYRLSLRFIEIEKNWRKENPTLQRQEFEKFWERSVSTENGTEFKFHGVMDRVDYFPEGALIFDYKNSRSQVSNYNSWIEKDQLQLLFYQWGLPEPVLGTLFYVLRDLKRDRGLMRMGSPIMPEEISSKALIDDAHFESIKSEFTDKLNDLMKMVEAGNLQAVPKDRKTCDDCSWRKTCRAQHLVKI